MQQIDPTKYRWRTVSGNPDRFSYRLHYRDSVLGYDPAAKTLDMILWFDDQGGHCPMHRHVTTTSLLVVQGELHLTDHLPGGEKVQKVRRTGDYHFTTGDEHPHMERGGPDGALVFYSHHCPDGRMYELLDEDLTVFKTVMMDEFYERWLREAA